MAPIPLERAVALRLIEGVWEQECWWVDGVELRPPQAVGRIVYAAGTVTLVMRFDAGHRENHRYGLGRYRIEGDRLFYGYDRMFDHTRDATGARSTPEAATGELKPFRLRLDGERLTCTPEAGPLGMVFEPGRMQVVEGTQVVRAYRRLTTC